MSNPISRRALLIGGVSAGGQILAGAGAKFVAPAFSGLYRLGETLTRTSHRLLLANDPLAREFGVNDISKVFPTVGTVMPEDEDYQRLLAARFVEWRLTIDGLVERPMSLSLADLKRMPARTQITAQSCERGWTAIAQWKGVQLSRILNVAEPRPEARYVVCYCVDGWYDSFSLDTFEALHPQSILAYGMNGDELPVQHGAPVRLRVERQLGWRSLKYINRISLVDRLDRIGEGKGSYAADFRFQWYGGI